MIEYLIRTNREERKTHLLRVETPSEVAGLIYTDFSLNPGDRDILLEDVVNPLSNKAIAQVKLYQNGNIISVHSKRKELSAFTNSGEYKENGIIIPYKKMIRDTLLSRPEYKSLNEMGVTHAYFLGDKSNLSQVFCFEKDGNTSGVIHTKERNNNIALQGITLALAQKIENQDFIFEFIKK